MQDDHLTCLNSGWGSKSKCVKIFFIIFAAYGVVTDRLSVINLSGPDGTSPVLSGVLSYRWNIAPIEKESVTMTKAHAGVMMQTVFSWHVWGQTIQIEDRWQGASLHGHTAYFQLYNAACDKALILSRWFQGTWQWHLSHQTFSLKGFAA